MCEIVLVLGTERDRVCARVSVVVCMKKRVCVHVIKNVLVHSIMQTV